MSDKLLPCPFCGSHNIRPMSGGSWGEGTRCYWIQCAACSAEGPTTKLESEKEGRPKAMELWTRRVINIITEVRE